MNPLKAYRARNGLTQQEVADKLKVSRGLVGLLENGNRNFSADMAVKMEKRLGIARAVIRPDYFGHMTA